MAFYKKAQMKVNGKWYPKSVLVVSPATTEQVAKRIAAESTVSPADVRAVLTALGGVLGDFMAQGRVSTRGLSDVDIEWEEWKGDEKGLTPAPSPEGEGSEEHPGPQAG